MPLRCVDDTGASIQSFDLDDKGWHLIKSENSTRRHLQMPCCGAGVILKRSRHGLRFFAHKKVGICTAKKETAEHTHLKWMVVEAARAAGWEAQTEVSGVSQTMGEWRADVLVSKGDRRLAVEIQWSGQTREETEARQARYRDSGLSCFWLFRQPGFRVSRNIPAICVGGSLQDGFMALLPHAGWSDYIAHDRSKLHLWCQAFPMEAFLEGMFTKRLRYGVTGAFSKTAPMPIAHLSTQLVRITCTSDWCREMYVVPHQVELRVGGASTELDAGQVLVDLQLVPQLNSASAQEGLRLCAVNRGHRDPSAWWPACPCCKGYPKRAKNVGRFSDRPKVVSTFGLSFEIDADRLQKAFRWETERLGWWLDIPDQLPNFIRKVRGELVEKSSGEFVCASGTMSIEDVVRRMLPL